MELPSWPEVVEDEFFELKRTRKDETTYKGIEMQDKSDDIEKELRCRNCYGIIPIRGEGVTIVLENCGHEVCSSCVTKKLFDTIKFKEQLLRCPFSDSCTTIMEEHEIRNLVPPDLLDEYLNMLLEKVKIDSGDKVINCIMSNCPGWCFVEDSGSLLFSCPVCGKSYSVGEANKPDVEDEIFLDDLDDETKVVQKERCNEMISLFKKNAVPNFVPFECPICYNTYKSYEGLVLKNCLHTFCKECLANTIIYSETEDIKCPYDNGKYTCDELITQCEIKEVLEPEKFQKYLNKSLLLAEKKAGKSAYHCKTKDCSGWWFFESGVERFLCPVCNKNNCFICQNIHEGNECVQEDIPDIKKSEALITSMLHAKTTIYCPNCGILIMKTYGCDAVICGACKIEVCWATGKPRWGPKGKGDMSGGCQCRPDKKCHDLCNNCH